jgi:anhydro-N-acetylmuramic acid kinase
MIASDLYIGLISGTSLDGVDCALVQFNDNQPSLLASHFSPSNTTLRQRTLQLCAGTDIDLRLYGEVDIELGRIFAAGVEELLSKANVDAAAVKAIGSHGQTVWHQPKGELPFTLQLADPNVITQLTGITTVADFRRRDIAAGGQGAPLASLLHRNCFSSTSEDRVVVNIGGMANITVLDKSGESLAFDTGPGNVLMDYWIGKNLDKNFDNNGDWARSGKTDQALLSLLLDEEYLSLPPPKSTGRELFNGHWLESKLQQCRPGVADADVQATLVNLTVATITAEIRKHIAPDQVYICGGGAHNTTMMTALQTALPDAEVASTAAAGLDPDWVEAIAFAWMAKQTLAGQRIETAAFTGATEPVILGGIYQA